MELTPLARAKRCGTTDSAHSPSVTLCHPLAAESGPGAAKLILLRGITTRSMRRFSTRPSGVSLFATGWNSARLRWRCVRAADAPRRRSASFTPTSLRSSCRPRNWDRRPSLIHAIECVRTVRNAWREVLNDPDANPGSARVIELPVRNTSRSAEDESTVVRWTASTASPGYGELFFQLLFLIEAGVVAIAGQQFIVPA